MNYMEQNCKELEKVSTLEQNIVVCVVKAQNSNNENGLFLTPANQIRQEKASAQDKEFIALFDMDGNFIGLFKRTHRENSQQFPCEETSDVVIWDRVY